MITIKNPLTPNRRRALVFGTALFAFLLLTAGRTAEPQEAAKFADGELLFNIKPTIAKGGNLGMTFWSDGFIGTNLANRTASMEYPLGSGIDHLVRGGLWIGGLNIFGDTLVSTATVAGSYGSRPLRSEYIPTSDIDTLSILPNHRHFNPDARSELDFHFSYADTIAEPDTTIFDRHRPLHIEINTETLLYSFQPFDAIIFMNLEIVNIHPTEPLFEMYVGCYTELATGFKAEDDRWAGRWFDQKNIGYIDSLRMVTEHHFTGLNGLATSWGGLQLLGTEPLHVDSLSVAFNWWDWGDEIGRTGLAPTRDSERWATMANERIRSTSGSEAPNQDPVEVISVGPFPVLEAGDTLKVSFAWIGGAFDPRTGLSPEEDLIFNAGWAQEAYDLGFNIPLPPPSPELIVRPDLNRLTLHWTDSPERFIDPRSGESDFEGYRLYIAEGRLETDFRRLLEVDVVDSIFYNTGLDQLRDPNPITVDGIEYPYRYDVTGLRDGFKYWTSITAFDTGSPDIPSLESGIPQNRVFAIPGTRASSSTGPEVVVFPNPYHGDAAWDGNLGRDRYLWFANLPARCIIRIYTMAGDHVDTIHFDQDAYVPTDIRGIYDPTDPRNPESDIPQLSGGMAAWDLISREDQGVASGLYIFAVEDLETGDKQLGKFLILK